MMNIQKVYKPNSEEKPPIVPNEFVKGLDYTVSNRSNCCLGEIMR
jgi:hypothetical protein